VRALATLACMNARSRGSQLDATVMCTAITFGASHLTAFVQDAPFKAHARTVLSKRATIELNYGHSREPSDDQQNMSSELEGDAQGIGPHWLQWHGMSDAEYHLGVEFGLSVYIYAELQGNDQVMLSQWWQT
jgi:hypothetical protein